MSTTTRSRIALVANLVEEALREEFPGEEIRKNKLAHITQVVELIKLAGGSTLEKCAAMLCEVINCALISPTKIEEMFGSDLRRLVEQLNPPATIASTEAENHSTEEFLMAELVRIARHIGNAARSVKLIKLAQETLLLEKIASTPPSDENSTNFRVYILGALRFMNACRGVSPILENEMLQAYTKAYSKHYRPQS